MTAREYAQRTLDYLGTKADIDGLTMADEVRAKTMVDIFERLGDPLDISGTYWETFDFDKAGKRERSKKADRA